MSSSEFPITHEQFVAAYADRAGSVPAFDVWFSKRPPGEEPLFNPLRNLLEPGTPPVLRMHPLVAVAVQILNNDGGRIQYLGEVTTYMLAGILQIPYQMIEGFTDGSVGRRRDGEQPLYVCGHEAGARERAMFEDAADGA